ncbi:hypothetical protein ACFYNW_26000 [Streptomyces virginiae]|uniref:hypothetical protein n=1 Tax=Streptomyces virginiae TaxID=1961 RepID=UPI0033A3E6F9
MRAAVPPKAVPASSWPGCAAKAGPAEGGGDQGRREHRRAEDEQQDHHGAAGHGHADGYLPDHCHQQERDQTDEHRDDEREDLRGGAEDVQEGDPGEDGEQAQGHRGDPPALHPDVLVGQCPAPDPGGDDADRDDTAEQGGRQAPAEPRPRTGAVPADEQEQDDHQVRRRQHVGQDAGRLLAGV